MEGRKRESQRNNWMAEAAEEDKREDERIARLAEGFYQMLET